jgi:hypothetical protein
MTTTSALTIKIIDNEKQNPPGKLADVELHFRAPLAADHPALQVQYAETQHEARAAQDALRMAATLHGLKLIGFAIWERRTGGGRNVTFPARQYSVNGERRSFALLRPANDATAQDRIREAILSAYAQHEEQAATADAPEQTATTTRTREAAPLFA